MQRAALTDGLTGLWNHTQFRELLDREFVRTRRYGGRVSMILVDLDHFKAVNDTFGHEAGNQVLKMTAQHLQRSARETDSVARYGGEEFAIVCQRPVWMKQCDWPNASAGRCRSVCARPSIPG